MPSLDLIAPQYARTFRCTGSKCPDNCCHGWNVSVDPQTWQAYRTNPVLIEVVHDKLVDNLDLSTKAAAPGYIKLDAETGQCSLQEASGLCSLQKQFGEAALCQTCASYPRTLKPLGEDFLLSMTDSCPEVARMLVHDAEALALDYGAVSLPDNLGIAGIEAQGSFQDRYALLQGLLTLLRHRDIALEMRLFICGLLIQRVQASVVANEEQALPQLVETFFTLTDQGYFTQQAEALRGKGDGALGLVILRSLMESQQTRSPLQPELEAALQGLELSGKPDATHLELLEKAHSTYLDRFNAKHPHALENLLVNWLLNDIFPITKANLQDGWMRIMVRYFLLRTLLCGIARKEKKLTTADVSRLAYRFGRGVSHSGILEKMQLHLIGRNLNNLTSFTLALKL